MSSAAAPVAGRLYVSGEWSAPRADFPSTSPANLDEVVGSFPVAAQQGAREPAQPGDLRFDQSG